MKIPLLDSWVLTDEHPMAAKGTPVLIDLETRKTYHPGDRIMGISAQQVVSLVIEMKSENCFLPEEMRFISQFKEEDHESNPAVQAIWAIGETLSMKNRIL
jgi:hypothetical protein